MKSIYLSLDHLSMFVAVEFPSEVLFVLFVHSLNGKIREIK